MALGSNFISVWVNFTSGENDLASHTGGIGGHMWLAGRRLDTPDLRVIMT